MPISEIDRAYSDLVPICTELNTSAGPLDILYATPQGKLVLLEAKLWRNPEARRKVIGQVLDYAKELNRWDYEELQKQVSARTSRSGNALYDLVRERYPKVEESDFVDEVSRSLRHGRFMFLIVGDGIREGVGAIAQFLSSVGELQFTLGLIEVGIYRMPRDEILVQPRVLTKTVIIDRTVIEIANPNIQIAKQPDEPEESVEEDTFYKGFWSEFLSNLQLDDVTQPLPKPGKGQSLFFVLPPNANNAWINAYFAGSAKEIGVYFRLGRNEFGEIAYRELERDKEAILAVLPASVQWGVVRGFHSVSLSMHIDDVWAESNHQRIKEFFAENVNALVNAFRKRMQVISDSFEST